MGLGFFVEKKYDIEILFLSIHEVIIFKDVKKELELVAVCIIRIKKKQKKLESAHRQLIHNDREFIIFKNNNISDVLILLISHLFCFTVIQMQRTL